MLGNDCANCHIKKTLQIVFAVGAADLETVDVLLRKTLQACSKKAKTGLPGRKDAELADPDVRHCTLHPAARDLAPGFYMPGSPWLRTLLGHLVLASQTCICESTGGLHTKPRLVWLLQSCSS